MDTVAGLIRLLIGAYLPNLFTRQSGGWIVCGLPGSHANNINSAGSDKLIEVQFYMSTSFQPGSLL